MGDIILFWLICGALVVAAWFINQWIDGSLDWAADYPHRPLLWGILMVTLFWPFELSQYFQARSAVGDRV